MKIEVSSSNIVDLYEALTFERDALISATEDWDFPDNPVCNKSKHDFYDRIYGLNMKIESVLKLAQMYNIDLKLDKKNRGAMRFKCRPTITF